MLFRLFREEWLDNFAFLKSLFCRLDIVFSILLLADLKSELFFNFSKLLDDFSLNSFINSDAVSIS